MAITYVQDTGKVEANANSASVTFGSNPTVNNTIFCGGTTQNTVNVLPTGSDSKGNTWSNDQNSNFLSGGTTYCSVYHGHAKVVTTGSSFQVTLTLSGGASTTIVMSTFEFSGIDTTSPFDSAGSSALANDTTGSTRTSPLNTTGGTPAGGNELAFVTYSVQSGSTATTLAPTSGFTCNCKELSGATYDVAAVSYEVFASISGAQTFGYTISPTTGWGGNDQAFTRFALYKASAATATPNIPVDFTLPRLVQRLNDYSWTYRNQPLLYRRDTFFRGAGRGPDPAADPNPQVPKRLGDYTWIYRDEPILYRRDALLRGSGRGPDPAFDLAPRGPTRLVDYTVIAPPVTFKSVVPFTIEDFTPVRQVQRLVDYTWTPYATNLFAAPSAPFIPPDLTLPQSPKRLNDYTWTYRNQPLLYGQDTFFTSAGRGPNPAYDQLPRTAPRLIEYPQPTPPLALTAPPFAVPNLSVPSTPARLRDYSIGGQPTTLSAPIPGLPPGFESTILLNTVVPQTAQRLADYSWTYRNTPLLYRQDQFLRGPGRGPIITADPLPLRRSPLLIDWTRSQFLGIYGTSITGALTVTESPDTLAATGVIYNTPPTPSVATPPCIPGLEWQVFDRMNDRRFNS